MFHKNIASIDYVHDCLEKHIIPISEKLKGLKAFFVCLLYGKKHSLTFSLENERKYFVIRLNKVFFKIA